MKWKENVRLYFLVHKIKVIFFKKKTNDTVVVVVVVDLQFFQGNGR
jgi:hypothetical protein